MNIKVESFTKGKIENHNDDTMAYNDSTFVLSDGATDNLGIMIGDQTRGEVASQMLADVCLKSNSTGMDLVEEINFSFQDYYKNKFTQALEDPIYHLHCTLTCAKILKDKIFITQVSDSGFRVNGTDIYHNRFLLEDLLSDYRAEYIEKTNDIEGSRDFLKPLLLDLNRYANLEDHPISYGVINGFDVPEKFVSLYEFDLSKIKTIELFSDGYFDFPEEVSIDSWESKFEEIEKLDPYKYKQYRGVKPLDDRSVMVIHF